MTFFSRKRIIYGVIVFFVLNFLLFQSFYFFGNYFNNNIDNNPLNCIQTSSSSITIPENDKKKNSNNNIEKINIATTTSNPITKTIFRKPETFDECYDRLFTRCEKEKESFTAYYTSLHEFIRSQYYDTNATNEIDEVEAAFADVYINSKWYKKKVYRNNSSPSGPGSLCRFSVATRCHLRRILELYEIDLLMDVVMGDYGWMREFVEEMVQINYDVGEDKFQGFDFRYLGSDSFKGLVDFQNHLRKGNKDKKDKKLLYDHEEFVFGGNVAKGNFWDIIRSESKFYGKAKKRAVFLRHALQHNTVNDVKKIINGVEHSGADYFIATNHILEKKNPSVTKTGGFYIYNLLAPPFKVKPPLMCVFENVMSHHKNKIYMCVWEIPMVKK